MNATQPQKTGTSIRKPAGRAARTALVVLLLACATVGCSKISSDATALRNGLVQASAEDWDKEFALGVGPLPLGLARAVAAFFELAPEPRAALQAMRAAEVGIYRHKPNGRDLALPALFTAADEAMANRGWERFVTVVNRHEWIAIYVPANLSSTRDVRVCLAVLDGPQLVVLAARSNLDPLLDLAFARGATPDRFLSSFRP